MEDFEIELKKGFIEEVVQLHSEAENCFLDLEKTPHDHGIMDKIFRIAHNIKGSAAAVGFEHLSKLAHHLENLLLKIKNKEIPPSQTVIDLLLKVNDGLKLAIESLQDDITATTDFSGLIEEIQQVSHQSLQPLPATSKNDYNHAPSSGLVLFDDEIINASINSTSQSKTDFDGAGLNQKNLAKDETIRVNLSRIDKLMNNVGELVILDTVLAQQTHLIPSQAMRTTLSQMQKIIREVQEVSMGFRMIPLRQTFQKMQRIVRDTSKSLAKDVDFTFAGEDTELDKTVVEQISDPLVHLIRNAVDHGIESPEERLAVHKPAKGHIHLSAYHRGNNIIIEIRDDGKGIDVDAIVKKALAKGLVSPQEQLSSEQAFELIFASGFSTKENVTDISGRGVGMDVVRTNIRELRGDITVESVKNEGSCFKINLPLTLAIIDGVTVRVKDQCFVVPIAQVLESIHPKKEQVNTVAQKGEVLMLRGKAITLHRLTSLVHLNVAKDQQIKPWQGIVLIAGDGKDEEHAILVDDIVGQQQVVIKSLGQEVSGLPGISGAAILGDGKPVPILDLVDLIHLQKTNKSLSYNIGV